jgi:hypothetical protein
MLNIFHVLRQLSALGECLAQTFRLILRKAHDVWLTAAFRESYI